MKLQYNPDSKDSIISFAKQLIGKAVLVEYAEEIPLLNLKGTDKGRLGKVIEELYFRYKPNSNKSADFKQAGTSHLLNTNFNIKISTKEN